MIQTSNPRVVQLFGELYEAYQEVEESIYKLENAIAEKIPVEINCVNDEIEFKFGGIVIYQSEDEEREWIEETEEYENMKEYIKKQINRILYHYPDKI